MFSRISTLFLVCLMFITFGGVPQELAAQEDEELSFIFDSVSDGGVDDENVHHLFFMTGSGKFNSRDIVGGGFFLHADGASPPVPTSPPFPPRRLISSGRWRAERMIRFTKVDHPMNPYGFTTAGVLEVEARLFPNDGPQEGIKATLKVVCNTGFRGSISTSLPEGYFLDIEDGLSFEPGTFPGTTFPTGLTAFTPLITDEDFSNVFFMPLAEGLNMISLPLTNFQKETIHFGVW